MSEAEYDEVARAGSERGEVVLRRRTRENAADSLELRVNGVCVMETDETSSEEALAAAALELVSEPSRVVVGGLGLGFTLQRVLADRRVAEVTVVEIEEALIGWMRDGTIPHGPGVLADERVRVVNADIAMAVAEAVADHAPAYDLVLLDIDNGPGYLVYDGNAGIYQDAFLTHTRALLRDGGAVVIWSADPAPELAATLNRVFTTVSARPCEVAVQGHDVTYWLYVATT